MLGTFQYMAPEQLEGHEADARSDLFALRRGALRDGNGKEGVHRQEPGVADRLDPARRPAAGVRGRADDAAGVEPRGQDVPREGPGGPVPDRARRQAPAPVDHRRRFAGRTARAGRGAAQEPRETGVGSGGRAGPRGRRIRLRGGAPCAGSASCNALVLPAAGEAGDRDDRAQLRLAHALPGRAAASPSPRPATTGRRCSGFGGSAKWPRIPSRAPRERSFPSGRRTAASWPSSRTAS